VFDALWELATHGPDATALVSRTIREVEPAD